MKQTLVLDSTQITEFHECPQKWEYSSVRQLTNIDDSRDSINMGSFGHKLLEHYYRNLGINGGDSTLAYTESIAQSDVIDYKLTDDRKKAVMNRFYEYWIKYSLGNNAGKDIVPSVKLKPKIIVVDGNFKTIFEKTPLVEMGFSYKLFESPEYLFVLEGMIDLIGKVSGMEVFADHKWQERRRGLYKKSVQFRNYSLVTGYNLGIVNYIRMAQKVDDFTFERDIISFSSQEIRVWKSRLIEIFIAIAKEVKKDERERRWGACSGKFGYPCEFTKLCEESNLLMRSDLEKIYYKKKEPWTPWRLKEKL